MLAHTTGNPQCLAGSSSRSSSSSSRAAARTSPRPFTSSSTGPRGCAAQHVRRCSSATSSNDRTLLTCSDAETVVLPGSSRRQLLSAAAVLSAALAPGGGLLMAPAAAAAAVEAPEGFKALNDAILAYSFVYPVQTASGGQLNMVLSHPPEKYSSAAPLTADARQRIVSELFDLRRFVTVSMTVGPASGVLKGAPEASWRPRDVALTVLIDRSTARLSSGQRTALNDIEEVHAEDRDDGRRYIVYEHTSQGSPTTANPRPETFRHALAVTTTRPGLDGSPYLYTLNLSCPQPLWEDLAGPFKQAVDSFRLEGTTRDYVPPDKDPWLFF